MAIHYRASMLRVRAERNPAGRAARLLAAGTVQGDVLTVEEPAHWDVLQAFPQRVPFRYEPAALDHPESLRPQGFAEFIRRRGRLEGAQLVLDSTAQSELQERFYPRVRPGPTLPDLSAAELGTDFVAAVAEWVRQGFPVVTRESYEARRRICGECEHWRSDALLGAGQCRKCGCSGIKLWLAPSKCPDAPPRW